MTLAYYISKYIALVQYNYVSYDFWSRLENSVTLNLFTQQIP